MFSGLGEENTPEVTALNIGRCSSINPFSDVLDAALVVRGIRAAEAAQLPPRLAEALTQATGATVLESVWGSGDLAERVHVRWRPQACENAVTHANRAAGAFAVAGRDSFVSVTVTMPRLRIARTWGPDLYVYPTSMVSSRGAQELNTPPEPGSPGGAAKPGPGETPDEEAAADGKSETGGRGAESLVVPIVVAIGVGVIGLGLLYYFQERTVRTNRRRWDRRRRR